MDNEYFDKIANYLTGKDLIIANPGRNITPAEHHRIMVSIARELVARFGFVSTVINKGTNLAPSHLSLATGGTHTGPVETSVAIPNGGNVQIAGLAPNNIVAGSMIGPMHEVETLKSSKDDKTSNISETSKTAFKPINENKKLVSAKSDHKAESKPTHKDSSLLDSEKVYSTKDGGWLKALSDIAKHIKANPDAPRSDPMRIAFNGSKPGKMVRINFWIEDILAFADLYDKHGKNIKKVFRMKDDEYDGVGLLKNVEFYRNQYPGYTSMKTRALMFAQCVGKFSDDCLETAMLNDGYIHGEGTWSDAYMHPTTKLCNVCFQQQRDGEFENNQNE